MSQVTFGIKTSQANIAYEDIVRTWREADDVPEFEHAWLWDHFVPLRGPVNGAALEAWTLLAALAAQTSRLRLGIIVTNNRARLPAVLAKMAATVDIISGGRLEFGIGAGAGKQSDPNLEQMVRREYDAYGFDVVEPAATIGALAETCTLVKRLWMETDPFDFDGRHYRLKGAICEPKPVQRSRPPIMIGAAGEKLALRVVAEHADVWNCPTRGDVDEFRRKSSALDEHCAAIGRDPKAIRRSVQLLIRADEAPEATREIVRSYIGAGADHIVLAPIPPYRGVRWLAEEIVQPVQSDFGQAR